MKSVKELKEGVNQRMKRCWGESCALFFISASGIIAAMFAGYLIMGFLTATDVAESVTDMSVIPVAAIIFLIMWIITVPYKYGLRWYRLQQVRGHSVHIKSVFSCYFSTKRMLQVYKLSAMLLLRKSWLLLIYAAFLGAGILFITSLIESGNSLGSNIAVAVVLVLAAVGYIAYTIIMMKYSAAPYLFAIGHDRPAGEIIKESVRFMSGKRSFMIEVLRKCAVMMLPCIIVFPLVFVIPKMMMLYTAAINEIIENGYSEDKLVSMERRD